MTIRNYMFLFEHASIVSLLLCYIKERNSRTFNERKLCYVSAVLTRMYSSVFSLITKPDQVRRMDSNDLISSATSKCFVVSGTLKRKSRFINYLVSP